MLQLGMGMDLRADAVWCAVEAQEKGNAPVLPPERRHTVPAAPTARDSEVPSAACREAGYVSPPGAAVRISVMSCTTLPAEYS